MDLGLFPDIPGAEITEALGADRFGDWYRGRLNSRPQHVGIRVFYEEFFEDRAFLAKFSERFDRAGRVDHPHLALIMGHGPLGAGYYLIREDLQELTPAYFRDPGGMLQPYRVIYALKQVAWALQAAGREGLTHQNIHPQCIMIREEGQLAITELGGEGLLRLRLPRDRRTPQDAAYISPDMVLGREIDQRADIYGLGGVLYTWLTGEPPYSGETAMEVENLHVVGDIPLLPSPAGHFQLLLNRFMAKDQDERLSDWDEVIQFVDEFSYTFPENRRETLRPPLPEAPAVQHWEQKKMVLVGAEPPPGLVPEMELDLPLPSAPPPPMRPAFAPVQTPPVSGQGRKQVLKPLHLALGGGGLLLLLLLGWWFSGGEEPPPPPPVAAQAQPEAQPRPKVSEVAQAVAGDSVPDSGKPAGEGSVPVGDTKRSVPPARHAEAMDAKRLLAILRQGGFADSSYFPRGGVKHRYEQKTLKGLLVVVDQARGLMWQQAGSEDDMAFEDTLAYVDRCNQMALGGFSDWRLPEVEEAASLLEPKEKSGALFIDPVFSTVQRYIWSAHPSQNEDRAWAIDFYSGDWNEVSRDTQAFVRLVRRNRS